jgi:hypothetical protein
VDLVAAAAVVPSYDGVLAGAALLGREGHPALALRFLDSAPRPDAAATNAGALVDRLRMAWLAHTNYYHHEFSELRKTIEQDLAVQSTARQAAAQARPD